MRWWLDRSLAPPEILMYFILKLQVKDQGKNEAGELYSKLEKVCYFSVLDFASWVFHVLHRNQTVATQWHAWPHSPHPLSFYVLRHLGVIHCSLLFDLKLSLDNLFLMDCVEKPGKDRLLCVIWVWSQAGATSGFALLRKNSKVKNKKNSVFSHWTIFLVTKILNQLEVSKMGMDLPRGVLVCWDYRGKPRFLGSELKQTWYHKQRAFSPLWFWLLPSIFLSNYRSIQSSKPKSRSCRKSWQR